MKTNFSLVTMITAIIFCGAINLLSGAQANEVKQLGAKPDEDQLIQSLLPPDSPNGQARGLQVLSGKSLEGKGTTHPSSGGTEASRAPAVALDVQFARGSAELTDTARDTIERIGKALTSSQLSGYRFLVEGHTDSTGGPEINLPLSQRRAEAVKAYLVSHDGVQAVRLETEGKGSAEPIDPEHPESGINRRVQIINLGQ